MIDRKQIALYVASFPKASILYSLIHLYRQVSLKIINNWWVEKVSRQNVSGRLKLFNDSLNESVFYYIQSFYLNEIVWNWAFVKVMENIIYEDVQFQIWISNLLNKPPKYLAYMQYTLYIHTPLKPRRWNNINNNLY